MPLNQAHVNAGKLAIGVLAVNAVVQKAKEVSRSAKAKADYVERSMKSPFGFGVHMSTEKNRSREANRKHKGKPGGGVGKATASLNQKSRVAALCIDRNGKVSACTIPGSMARKVLYGDAAPQKGYYDRKEVSWAYGGAWMDEKYFPVLPLDGDAMLTLHLVFADGTVDESSVNASMHRLAVEPCFDAMLNYFPSCDVKSLPGGSLLYFSGDPLVVTGGRSICGPTIQS